MKHFATVVVAFLVSGVGAQEADKVLVTASEGEVKSGEIVIATVGRGTLLSVKSRREGWVGVGWAAQGVKIRGWIKEESVEPFLANRVLTGELSTEGYRNAKWGMTGEQVRGVFPQAFRREDGNYLVRGDVAGAPAQTTLIFTEGRFTAVAVVFSIEGEDNKAKSSRQYGRLRGLLIKKYGAPSESGPSQATTGGATESTGTAASSAGPTRRTTWEAPKTEIELFTTTGIFEIDVTIRYESKELANLAKYKEDQRALDDL